MDKTRKLILFKILPFFLAILMVGLLIFEAILPAQAAEVILEFTYNGQTCQVQAGTSGSNAEAGVIWTVTGTNNVELTFEKSGTFALTAGSTFNLSGATAIGGGGGGGAAGGMWANSSFVSNNWNAQSVGLGGAGGQITTASSANITALNGQSLVIEIGEGGSGGKAKNSDCYTGYITIGSNSGGYDTEHKNVSMTTSATNGYYAVEYVGYQCCDHDVTNTSFTRDKGTSGGTTTVKVGASTILTATGGAAEGGASPSAPLAWGNGVNGTSATSTRAASGGSGACTYQNSQTASWSWGDDGFETGAGNVNETSYSCWLCGENYYGGFNWDQVSNTATIPRDSTARAYVNGSRMVGGTGGSGGTYSTGAAGNGGSPGNDHNCDGFTIYSNRGTDATGYGNGGGGGALSTVRYGIGRFGDTHDGKSTILGRFVGSGGNGASGAVMLTGTASREVSAGSLTIIKASDYGTTGITRSFTVTGPNSYSKTFTMPSSGTYTIDDLPLGTYTVRENNASNYDVYVGTDASGTLLSEGASTASQTATISTNGQTVTVEFYNKIKKGSLTITKGADVSQGITQTFVVRNMDNGDSSMFTMPSSGTYTINDLPLGTYIISEVSADSSFIVHRGTSAEGIVLDGAYQMVTLTTSGTTVEFYNEIKKGGLTITKGAEETQDITRQFTVTGPYDYSNTFTMPSSGTYTISDIPIGTYTITELDSSGYVVHSGTSVTGEVLVDATQTVTLTTSGATVEFYNDVEKGNLTITKDSDYGISGITRKFIVTGPNSYSNTFTMPSSGTYTISNLPTGTYTVTELDSSDYIVHSGTSVTGTVLANATQTVTLTTSGATVEFYNEIKKINLKITKGSDIPQGITRQFKVTGPNSYSHTFTMPSSGTYTINDLPIGSYTIMELDSSDYIVHSGTSAADPVTDMQYVAFVSSGGPVAGATVTVEFYNEIKKGDLTITKGAEETQDITRQFTVTGPYDYSNTFTMPSSGTYTLSDIPIGTYTITELDNSGYVVHSGTSVTGTVLADAAQTVTLTTSGSTVAFYNEPARGNIHITKSASDGLVEGVGFTVTGPDGYTNTFNMPDSGVYDITDIPLGAYTITENGASSYTVYAGTDNTGTSISDGAATASQTVNLTADGQTVNVNFYNDRIKGSIIIKKYASNGTEGITKQFKITGISEGTSYPAGYIVDMPSTGTLEVGNLYVGTYTVEELNTDGYVVHKGNTVGGEVLVNASQTVVAARTGATVRFFNEKNGGEITIKKTASDGRIAGIVFTVTGPSYPTGQDFTTNAAGIVVSERVLPGEYTIKEKDPTGYAVYKGTNEFGDELANAAVTVTVNADITVEFYNKMLTGSLTIQKNSEDGTSYREGKRFTVTVISDGPYQGQSWPAVTNASGIATFNNLPIGTYRVDEDEYDNYIAYSDTVTISNGNASTLPVRNVTRKGGISIYKVDSVMGNTPQGDASLGNAVFEIVNMSGKTIVYNGLQIEDGEIACTLTTDSSGYATTGAEMISTGTYLVREVTAPTGYILNSAWSRTVTFTENGDMLTLTASDACPDDVILGGISITKTSDVDVLLPNTEFSITNASAKAVVVNGTVFNPGAEIMRVTTDEYGIARTGNVLPYGSYSVRETRAPQGYKINADWNPTVQIRELNVSQQLTCSDDTDLHNIIIKKNLNLVSEYGIPTVTYGQPIFMFKVYGYDVNNIYHEWYSYLYGLAESDSRECGFYNIPSGIYTIEEIPVSGYKLTGIIAGENTTVNGLAGATANLLAENANATVCFENHIDQVDKIFSNDVVKNHIEEAHVSTLTMMRLSMRDSADISAVLLDNMVMYLSSEPYEFTEGDEYNGATVIAVYNDISTSVEDIPWADCADEIDVVNVEDDGVPVSFVFKWFTEAQIMGEVDKTFTVVYVDEFDAATHTDTVNVTEPGFIDITEAANGNTGIAEGKLYGGMFTDNDGEKDFSKYGLRFVPENGETYYVREIPESYLRADAISVYPSGEPYAEAVYAVLPVSDIDFSRIGFEVNTDGVVSDISGDRIYNDVSIEYADFTKCIYKPVDLFGASLSNAFIYAAELEVNKTENGLVAPEQTITITPYWITRDGVKVSSAVSCTVNTNDGVGVNYNGLTAITATATMAESYIIRDNTSADAELQINDSFYIYQTVVIEDEPINPDEPEETEPPENSDEPGQPNEDEGPADEPEPSEESSKETGAEEYNEPTEPEEAIDPEIPEYNPDTPDEENPENIVIVDFEAGNISYTINGESEVKQAINKNILVDGAEFNSKVKDFMEVYPVEAIVFGMYSDYAESVPEWAASNMFFDAEDNGRIRGFYGSESRTLYVLADGVIVAAEDSSGMFENFGSVEKIIFEYFVLPEKVSIDRMFKGCINLVTIMCDEDWSEQTESGADIFTDCGKLKGGENTECSSQTDLRYARVDKIGTVGMFTATMFEVKYERYYNPVSADEASVKENTGAADNSDEISDILIFNSSDEEDIPESETTEENSGNAVIISG